MTPARVLVVGGGITGLTTAALLAIDHGAEVTVREAAAELGGKIRTSPFAGLPAVDEGADAFLARQPHAIDLARRLGLGDELTSPTTAAASVWHNGLHPIPGGVMLGVPASVTPFVRTHLLSWRGKARLGSRSWSSAQTSRRSWSRWPGADCSPAYAWRSKRSRPGGK